MSKLVESGHSGVRTAAESVEKTLNLGFSFSLVEREHRLIIRIGVVGGSQGRR